MVAPGAGAIVVTGATASLRGTIGTAAFASAKAGQRALAQSMAKRSAPRGCMSPNVIVDGVIGTPATRARMATGRRILLDPEQSPRRSCY